MDINEAVYLIRSKEKMIRPMFEVGEGSTKAYLENRINAARLNTKKELQRQVREGYFTKAEAKGIHEALATMSILECLPTGEAVATFPEFWNNELYVYSVAIRLEE